MNAQDNIVGSSKAVAFPTSGGVALGSAATPYVMPRRIGSGSLRGTQNITGTLAIIDSATRKANISLSGPDGYQLFTDPTSGVNQIIVGKLPDGSYGMVTSPPGVDVLSLFA